MTIAKSLAIGMVAVAVTPSALTYELTTHAAMTYNAYAQSKVGSDRAIARDLGIVWFLVDPGPDSANWDSIFKSTNPFGKIYIDTNSTSGGSDLSREATHSFEGKIIDGRLKVPAQTLPGWLMRGAVREDDSGSGLTAAKGEPLDSGNEAMTDLSDTNKAPVEVTIDDGDPPQ
jgi:hypothetical protein